jgi:hypothetical protein
MNSEIKERQVGSKAYDYRVAQMLIINHIQKQSFFSGFQNPEYT